jgi:ferritin-like metal-binding protein YciE
METKVKKQEVAKGIVAAKTNASEDLRGLFEGGLKDLYWAEKSLSKSLPKMVENASSPELVRTLKNQLTEKEEHVSRLEQMLKTVGIKPTSKKCEAMEGLLKESEVIMKETKMGVVRDAGIIAAGQKMKHYEIATYGTLHAFAQTLGEDHAAKLLAMTLEDEKKTDAALTGIAVSAINQSAASAKVHNRF